MNTLGRVATPEQASRWQDQLNEGQSVYKVAGNTVGAIFAGGPGIAAQDQALVQNKVAVSHYIG